MKRLVDCAAGVALMCILAVLIDVMWIAEMFHKLDGGQGYWGAMDDI